MSDAMDMSHNIARNAASYDLLPYESKAIPNSHPARLGAIARIFGLDAPDASKARILELGCASGGNLIPMAMQYPYSYYLGVDISARQVEDGNARIAALGLNNIEIKCASFSELLSQVGQFDYIICHGVFSWVPKALQDKIFETIEIFLKPDGIAYISYNVLPGWRMLQPLRDAFKAALPGNLAGEAKAHEAYQLLGFLSAAAPPMTAYGQSLDTMLERFKKFSVSYVAHEYLEDTNEPCLFKDFVQEVSRFNLCYLGECELNSMVPDHMGKQVAEEIRRRAEGDVIATEQLMDLVRGRTFRQTLLVRGHRCNAIMRDPPLDCLRGLSLNIAAGTKIETEGGAHKLVLSGGEAFLLKSKEVTSVLQELCAIYPASLDYDEAVIRAEGSETLRRGLRDLIFTGVLVPTLYAIRASPSVVSKPKASIMAQADAKLGAEQTTNLKHEPVSLEPATCLLLRLMDGTRTVGELKASLLEEFRAGRFEIYRDGKVFEDKDHGLKFIEENALNLMSGLARAALLEA